VKFEIRYDAVIVGGGHNGLVAATYLAQAGQSVLLLERNAELGGAACSDRVFPGMDAWLSRYAYLVSLLPETIVHDLDLRFACRRRAVASCTPYERAGTLEALLLSNSDADRSLRSFLTLTNHADWRGYNRLLTLQHAFAALVWPSLLQPLRTRQEWQTSIRTALEREAWEAFVERPLGETVERHVRDDLLRGLIFTDAKVGLFTHAHDPTLLQNRCYILHVIGRGTGEWQVPVGGMGQLVSELASAAQSSGAHLGTRSPVGAVHPGVPRHTVVFQHHGEEHAVEATRVLVNASPGVFARLLGQSHAPAPGDEGSVCKVNILVTRLPRLKADKIDPRDAFAGTFHVDESYEQMEASYRQAATGEIPEHPPSEMYCHTLTDDSILGPDLQEAGYHTLTLFGLDMPYRLFGQDNGAVKDEVLRRYLRRLNRFLVDPIEECLAVDGEGNPCIEVKSPCDLEEELALDLGNIFHGAPSWFFTDSGDDTGRWGVETAFERVYRCGSSAVRGGGVSGIPGHNAARCILEEVGVST